MYKVMLVEDENILRKGIEVLTDWKSLNCEVSFGASNGIEALEFAKLNQLDIVITDIRMPGMDGLKLIKKLKEINCNIAVIILSAYSDFQYAQEALALEVKQYVLKTNFREKLPMAILNTIEKLKKANIIEVNFSTLFLKTTMNSEIMTWFNNNLEPHQPYYILSFETLNNKTAVDLIKFINYAYKSLNPVVTKISDNLYALLVSFKKGTACRTETLIEKSEAFIKSCKTLVEIEINIGLSGEYNSSLDFNKAKVESLNNLGRIYKNSTIKLINKYSNLPLSIVDCSVYAKNIIDEYILGDLDALSKTNDEFFKEMEENNYDLEHAISQVGTLFTLLGTSFQERAINIEEFLKITSILNSNEEHSFSCFSLKNLVLDLLIVLAKAFSSYIDNSLLLRVNSYIENNYKNPITIEEISNSLHLSSNYLGRQYKKETGINVLQYLNEYRVEKAKELLKEGKLQISEISFEVGYSNPAYFSNVFSKITGVSPKNFIQN